MTLPILPTLSKGLVGLSKNLLHMNKSINIFHVMNTFHVYGILLKREEKSWK